jgi:hypothetical protein
MVRKKKEIKKGRPPDPIKLARRNCTLWLERDLLNYIAEQIPALNISKVATNAIIIQILYTCNYKIKETEIDKKFEEANIWKEKLFLFDEYLHKRAAILAKKGRKAEIDANYDLMRYLLVKQEGSNGALFEM